LRINPSIKIGFSIPDQATKLQEFRAYPLLPPALHCARGHGLRFPPEISARLVLAEYAFIGIVIAVHFFALKVVATVFAA
jgi:hypothetical protein